MTLSLPSSAKPAAALVALAWTALTFGTAVAPGPVQAAEGPYYRAELASPVSPTKSIVSGTVFNCNGTGCAAGKATSRPAIVCARLVRQVGPVARFTANGKDFAADELARCNGK
ncbi:MAG: hypothetical protein ACEQR8_08105 [Cypionkella sp.]